MEQATLFDLAPYTEESTGGYAPDWLQEKLSAAPAVRAIGLTDLRDRVDQVDQIDQIDQLDQNLSENDRSRARFGGNLETSAPEPYRFEVGSHVQVTSSVYYAYGQVGEVINREDGDGRRHSLPHYWIQLEAVEVSKFFSDEIYSAGARCERFKESEISALDVDGNPDIVGEPKWFQAALVTMPLSHTTFKEAIAIASSMTIGEAIKEIEQMSGRNKTRLTALARQLRRIEKGKIQTPASALRYPDEALEKAAPQQREKIYLDWRGIFQLENGEFLIKVFSPEGVEVGTLTAPTTSPSIAYNLFRTWVQSRIDAEDKDDKPIAIAPNNRDTGAEFGGESELFAPELCCEAKSDGLFAIGDRVTFDFSEHPHLRDFQGQITQFGVTPGTYVVRLNGRSGETHFLGKNLTLLSEQLDTGSDSSTNADIMSVSSTSPANTDSDIVSVSSTSPANTDSDIVSVSSTSPANTGSDIVSVSSTSPANTDSDIVSVSSTSPANTDSDIVSVSSTSPANTDSDIVSVSSTSPANTDSDIVSVSSTSPANTDSDIVSVSSTSPANTDSDIVSVSSTSPANTDSDIVSVSSTSPANTGSDIVSVSSTSPANTGSDFRHQVEEYRPAGRDIKYFRYVYWVQDRRVCRHICGGNTLNALARSRAIAISQAIAQRRSPQEIERMLSGR